MNNTMKSGCERNGMAGIGMDAGSPRLETLREENLIPVAQAEGQAVYDTRRLAPGSYTVELVNAGKHVDAQKLVVRQ